VDPFASGYSSLKLGKCSEWYMKNSGLNNESSYYKRPSKALKRGGGFFVPGFEELELERVIGGILLFAFALNIITIDRWILSLELSFLSGFFAILLWVYLQLRDATRDSAAFRRDEPQLVPTKPRRKEQSMRSLSSIEDELLCLLDVLENFCRVEYIAIFKDVEPFVTVPLSVQVSGLVPDVAELLYRNMNKALYFSVSRPFQPELLSFVSIEVEKVDAFGLWLYPFYCPLLEQRFAFVVCLEGTQRLSSENGKWLTEWVKNRLLPYLEFSHSSIIR